MAKSRKHLPSADVAVDDQTAALLVDTSGGGDDHVSVPVAQAGAGTLVIVAADAGKTVNIHEVNLSLDVAGTIVLKDSDGTVFATWNLAATGQKILPLIIPRTAGRQLAADKGLTLTTTGGSGKGFITYSAE